MSHELTPSRSERNRRVLLDAYPGDTLDAGNFRTVVTGVPVAGPGEVLVRTVFLMIASGQRAFIQGPTFRERVALGEVMYGPALAEVVSGPPEGPAPGEMVFCAAGWQDYAVLPVAEVTPLGPLDGPLVRHLGVYGLNGLTAYFGMYEVGRVEKGETVVVSAAAGGVGHLAGQLAKIAGARVVGITSSAEKNRFLRQSLGFDATVSRRSATFAEDLRAACPDGVDVFFDNVAGPVLEEVLPVMAHHGRVVCCGTTSHYDSAEQATTGPRGIPLLLTVKSLTMAGLLVNDFEDRWPEALGHLAGWVSDGGLIPVDDIRDGLESAPAALVDMMAGGNIGQLSIRIRKADHERVL
jgi:NADPH-dependent curcumin reductase CurA